MIIPCRNATNPIHFFTQILPVLILVSTSSHGFASSAKRVSLKSEDFATTHYNFLKKGRHNDHMRVLSCGNDPSLCLDPMRNPWGGATCCFQKYCKDTRSDPNHCGRCGKSCAFGLICCGGRCVDVQNDPYHCGSCFEECSGPNRCSFAMCGYG